MNEVFGSDEMNALLREAHKMRAETVRSFFVGLAKRFSRKSALRPANA